MDVPGEQLQDAERRLGVSLPQDYRDFVAGRTATLGLWSSTGAYLMLVPAGDLVALNEAAQMADHLPGAVIIGGDGARESLVYDCSRRPPPLLLVDACAQSWADGIPQAGSLTEFLDRFPTRGWTWE